MYGAVVERGIIRAADQKKYIVETLDRKGIESLQITALNGAPFAVGDIVYFFLFPDGTGKIICSEAANDTTGFVVDANYVHTDNNYTDDEKAKLSDIEAEAQKNVQSDWNAESGDAFIKNKPTIVALPVSVQNGGTGATTAQNAKVNLGLSRSVAQNFQVSAPASSANQFLILSANVITEGHPLYGKQLQLYFTTSGILLWNNTDRVAVWNFAPKETVYAALTCESVVTQYGNRKAWPINNLHPPVGNNLTLTVRNATNGSVYTVWYFSPDKTFEISTIIAGSAPNDGDVIYVTYQA